MQEYHLHKEASPHVQRPQILGLTASLVFNTKDAEASISALEASLDAIVITAKESATEAASYFKKPIERVVWYSRDDNVAFETDFEIMLEDLEIWEYVKEDAVRNRIENIKLVRSHVFTLWKISQQLIDDPASIHRHLAIWPVMFISRIGYNPYVTLLLPSLPFTPYEHPGASQISRRRTWR